MTQLGDRLTPPHMMHGSDPYVLENEALETSLALSRCADLIRTSSYLAGWSKVFSPRLRTITLNTPNRSDTRPDALIIQEEEARRI